MATFFKPPRTTRKCAGPSTNKAVIPEEPAKSVEPKEAKPRKSRSRKATEQAESKEGGE